MTILTYNGYQASVDYEDGHLVIQLLHIDDFISDTCDDAREVEETFHKLVDEYLETCRQLGREPKKPYKGSLNIRMPPELHRRTAMAANSAKVSLNAWIVTACQEKLTSIEETQSESYYPPRWVVATGSLSGGNVSWVGQQGFSVGDFRQVAGNQKRFRVFLESNQLVTGSSVAPLSVIDPTETTVPTYRRLETKAADWFERRERT